MDINVRIEEMTEGIKSLASELRDKQNLGLDRIQAIQGEITARDAQLEELYAEKRAKDVDTQLASLEERFKAFNSTGDPSAKAAAILAGAGSPSTTKAMHGYSIDDGTWLRAIVDATKGHTSAHEFIKAVLGTSDATGQALVPNNFVAELQRLSTQENIYRGLMTVVPNVAGAGVDIPYTLTAIQSALLQGAYGSNKDIRDFSFGQATATLYTIAQIVDLGNQLIRQSAGAAEQEARIRLGEAIGRAESNFVINGTGSSQPLGILPAIMAFGDVAATKYTLSSETRAAALGNGLSKAETNFARPDGIVMHPTDFWEMTTETLGTSGSGGWAMDPTGGALAPRVTVWGVPVYRDTNLTVGTALIGEWSRCRIYTGQGYTIDVSSEAGSRFDQNVTGFRAEEEFAFNAEPYVRTLKFVKVLGL